MPNPNTAVFPSAIASDTDLPVATGSFSTTLTGDINFSTTTVPVSSIAAEVPVLLRIENEIILAAGKSGSDFTGCVRGFGGTTATGHSTGVQVFGYIFAHHYNQLAAEVKAIEDALGAELSNVVTAGGAMDIPQFIYYRAAVSQSSVASGAFSFKLATKPTAGSIEGTNHTYGVLDFAAGGSEEMWEHFALPDDFKFNSSIEVQFRYITPDTSGTVVWSIDAETVEPSVSLDPGSWTWSETAEDSLSGLANRFRTVTATIDTTGSLIHGDEFVFRITRGADTAVSAARLVGIQFKLTRCLNQSLPE